MASKDEVVQIIYLAIDDINQDLPADGKLGKSPSTVLLGDDSKLDSLAFINFILAVEERVRERLGDKLSLVNQDSMSSTDGPFQTVEKLAQFIVDLRSGAK